VNRRRLRVVICGGGIAGLSLALSLHRRGHTPLIVERAPGPRSEGYMLDLFGPGYTAAEKLGLLSELGTIHVPISRLAFVDRDGRERFALPYASLRELIGGRHFNLMRGDLERILHGHVATRVEVRFKTSIEDLEQDGGAVHVRLSDGTVERADLLVGADGVRSRVRTLAFGRGGTQLRYLGFHAAAFIIDDAELAAGAGDAFHTLTLPHRQVSVYPIRGGRLATLFVHEAEAPVAGATPAEVGAELRRVYGDLGWLVPRLLGAVGPAPYYDDVAQVVLPRWSDRRVTLLGDACGCVSLLAGQGAALAMAGGWLLAEELSATDDLGVALARYERRLRPAVVKKQRAGRRLARFFVPSGQVRLALRDAVLRMSSTSIGGWLMRRSFSADEIPAH
jgi:2-polyprenyl-6-methoxyphenol hydroxylase-like FAD-dependent oxidoreductase